MYWCVSYSSGGYSVLTRTRCSDNKVRLFPSAVQQFSRATIYARERDRASRGTGEKEREEVMAAL